MTPYKKTICMLFIVLVVLFCGCLFIQPRAFEGFVDPGRCGSNLGVCPEPYRCVNGYCKSAIPPTLPPFSDLPVKPARYTW